MSRRGRARSGVARELVRAHRDPAPLLELVEAALDDVAAAVTSSLLLTEVDRSPAALAAVSDLIVALRNRRGDPALAQPRAVRFGRVALVREYPVRPRSWPASRAWHADLAQRCGQHAGVRRLPGSEDERQCATFPVADKMALRRQSTAGAADRMIGRLFTELLVVRQSPPWCGEGWRRAGVHARSWSRSTRPSPGPRTAVRATASSRAPAPTRPARTTG